MEFRSNRNTIILLMLMTLEWGGAYASLFDALTKSTSHDGVSRVQRLSLGAEYDSLSSVELAVVFVAEDQDQADPPAESERLAQILSVRSVPVPVYYAAPDALNNATYGQVFVFRGGRRFTYHGVREATYIVKFISHLENANLKMITGKLDKVAFDHVREMKIVGYFIAGSAELQVYEQAASLFGTQVHFYVVTDPVVAKHMKLNATGQIYLAREFDKTPIRCPSNPATLADIQQLLVFNKDTFVKVTPLNVLDPSLRATPAIILLTDSASPLSLHLLKLIVRNQRSLDGTLAAHTPKPVAPAPETTTGSSPTVTTTATMTSTTSRILWLDRSDFPTLESIAPVPGLGFWNPATQLTQWMDLLPLNGAPTDKVAEEANLLLVQAFLKAHPTAGSVLSSAIPTSPPAKVEL